MKNYAIILASGSGQRTGLDVPKQFIKIAGKTVLEHTLDTFENHLEIDEIIIVSNPDYIELTEHIIGKNNYKKVKKILAGGSTRRESSFIGINSIENESGKVLIHDAVRPFMQPKIIDECLKALKSYDAVDVAISSADTIIKVNNDNLIDEIPERKYLKRGQTPQAFDLQLIRKAHNLANKSNIDVTDDCGLVVKLNLAPVYVVEGDNFNRKITYPIDVAIADKLFQLKSINAPASDFKTLKNKVIVVLGASKGIGKSICETAEKYNAKVYGYSRSNGIDITVPEQIKKALEEVYNREGKIDYVVNTAGILRMGKLNCRDIEDIINEINTNYIGCINVARYALDYLEKSEGSLLFFTSSSYTKGRAMYSIYSSTKAAIVNLVQALAEEYTNVRINVINPERTATPMRFQNFGKEPEETLLKPEKVAAASCNTLLSGCTGQVIDVRREQ